MRHNTQTLIDFRSDEELEQAAHEFAEAFKELSQEELDTLEDADLEGELLSEAYDEWLYDYPEDWDLS